VKRLRQDLSASVVKDLRKTSARRGNDSERARTLASTTIHQRNGPRHARLVEASCRVHRASIRMRLPFILAGGPHPEVGVSFLQDDIRLRRFGHRLVVRYSYVDY
jgi:hypothetical protein